MSERFLRLIIITISLTAHLLAYLQYLSQETLIFIANEQRLYFLPLVLCSALITLLLPAIHRQHRIFWMLGTKGVILLIIGRMFGNYFGIELTLLTALIIEASIFTNFFGGLSYSLGLIFLAVCLQPGVKPLGVTFAIPALDSRLTFCIYSGLTATVVALLRFQRENQVSADELNRRLDEATVELARANMKLQEYAITAEQEAMLNERKRVAREIHDTLAYTLTNLVMMMEAAIDLAVNGRPGLIKHLELAREQSKEGLVEVRSALQALRPVQYNNLNGLLAIHRLVKAFEKATQIRVKLELGDAPLYFGEEASQAVFRLVQEGMTNALRHGRATEISLIFVKVGSGLNITISDNGVGNEGSGPQTGYGLVGMKERIEQLGGELGVSSVPGKGFTLKAWIPLAKE